MLFARLFSIALLLAIASDAFSQRYLFYLHGRIVEDQGPHAVDSVNGYGAYRYLDILESFRKNFTVLSEVRARNTDPRSYGQKIAKQIDSLISIGIRPNQVTVVGASKGSIIAMLVSSHLKNKDVNFVFMAGCNESIAQLFPEIKFYGNILSIFEKSDTIGRTCQSFRSRSSSTISHYKEIELSTGLRHGFIFRPLDEWVNPASQWASGNYN